MLSRFLTLSPELLVQIISYLSFKDIISCEKSCRHLSCVVKNSVQLKYLKEAGRTGVYDPLTPGLTFPERIEKLRRWEKSWEDLNIPETTARITFDLDIWSPLIGSLHNGHLIVTDADPVVYAYSDLSRLPRILPIRSIEFGNLTLVREGLVHAFAFADEYDLVVIISTYVLLLRGVHYWLTLCPFTEANEQILNIIHTTFVLGPPLSPLMSAFSRCPSRLHTPSRRTHKSMFFLNHDSF